MLSRRWIVNGLLILSILLVAFIGYRLDAPSETAALRSPAQPGSAAIERIEIETGSASLRLVREADGWAIVEPVHWPADSNSVKRLIGIVDTGNTPPLDAASADLAALGLDKPVAQLRIGDTRVGFGATNNIGARRYTMIDSELYLLDDRQLPFVLQGLSGFVDRHLMPPRFELTALSLPGNDLVRDDSGDWRTNGDGAVDIRRLAELADNWQRLEASRISAIDPARHPQADIAATLDDGSRHQFLLLSVDPELVIANPELGLQYHFHAGLYDQLISPRDDENPA
ncbi:MAG TPA: DUF4340 domain-containing protein [Gammaproteobacteria bacterium]|nr:DUF4340 domain-containing protein [Gammaproteobacteria bacterium]